MIKKRCVEKKHLININIRIYYIFMLTSFKFNYRPYKIKVFVLINKIYLCVRINLIIYVIVTEFLIFIIFLLLYNT